MNSSIIIAARNAETTLERTIRSVLAQTDTRWQLLIVDNGSTDGTLALARAWAARDMRIRVLVEPEPGVSRARNRALAEAWFEWLMFLDADDTLTPDALAKLKGRLYLEPELDAVHAAWDRIDPAGKTVPVFPSPVQGDLFAHFAVSCVFAIHACMVRRRLVQAAGGFDLSLKTCEDWDLWLRICRMGARFGYVDATVAHYHMRRGSASSAGMQLARDGLVVVRRSHAPDPRVRRPVRAHARGEDPAKLPAACCQVLGWSAGLAIGSGDSGLPVLEMLGDIRQPGLSPGAAVAAVMPAILLPGCHQPDAWPAIWPRIAGRLHEYFAALGRHHGDESFAGEAMREARLAVLPDVPAAAWPVTLGDIAAVQVDAARPLADLAFAAAVTRAQCHVGFAGAPLGTLELPVIEGRVVAPVLADAIAGRWSWELLGHFLQRHRYPRLKLTHAADRMSAWDGGKCLLADFPIDETWVWESVHHALGWLCFLQDLWNAPHAGADELQAAQTAGDDTAPAVAVEGPRAVVEISAPPAVLTTRQAEIAVLITAGGAAVCSFGVRPKDGRVTPQVLRERTLAHVGRGLIAIVVREAVLGRSLEEGPATLRERLAARAAGDGLAPCGAKHHGEAPAGQLDCDVLPRRRAQLQPRRVLFPASQRATLDLLAQAEGEPPVVGAAATKPLLYLPDIVLAPQRPAPAAPADSGTSTGGCRELPILMYHRVAPAGAGVSRRYRQTPEEFERQLALLRRLGCRPVSLAEWHAAVAHDRPLPRRGVMLTFDDGFQDFYEYAWPLLRRYGFTATVFLVADRIGGTNTWDASLGETLPLMGWREIRELQAGGISFGAHTRTHPHLPALPADEMVEELARSRATLLGELGACDSIAYPFGDCDDLVQHFSSGCGYSYGLTCEERPARFSDGLLALPRLEVRGGVAWSHFRNRFAPPLTLRVMNRLKRMRVHNVMKEYLPKRAYQTCRKWFLRRTSR